MEKRQEGGGGSTVLRLLGAAVLASLLLRSAGAADDAKWHAHARAHPVAAGAVVGHGAPAPRATGLPPLSAPPPTAGADDLPPPVSVSASSPPSRAPGQQQTAPHFGFPLQPGAASAAAPGVMPGPGGEGYPFIGSNPTVPLPTGMTDTSTVLPMPDTTAAATKVAGLAAASRRPRVSMIGLGLFFATLFLYNI